MIFKDIKSSNKMKIKKIIFYLNFKYLIASNLPNLEYYLKWQIWLEMYSNEPYCYLNYLFNSKIIKLGMASLCSIILSIC